MTASSHWPNLQAFKGRLDNKGGYGFWHAAAGNLLKILYFEYILKFFLCLIFYFIDTTASCVDEVYLGFNEELKSRERKFPLV